LKYTKGAGKKIREMLVNGDTYGKITKETGVAKSTVAYHARQMGIIKKSGGYRYDWPKIQAHINNGGNYESCISTFNISISAIRYASKHKLIDIPAEKQPYRGSNGFIKKPMNEILVENSSHSCNSIFKKRLVKEKILKYYCHNALCILHNADMITWCNEPIVLHLDHINGIRNDNRKENLRFLCPNCHSQTKTYCGRNK